MRKEDAEDILAETLGWLLYYGPRSVAEWAAETAWLLVAYEKIPRSVWERESERCAAERGEAFRFPDPFAEDDGLPLSSPQL